MIAKCPLMPTHREKVYSNSCQGRLWGIVSGGESEMNIE
jgi:hypothetical protein